MKTYTDKLKSIEIKSIDTLSISALKDILRAANNYDWHAAYIDDFKQYNKALKNNDAIATYISLYDVTQFKYFDSRIVELNKIVDTRKENNCKGYENI